MVRFIKVVTKSRSMPIKRKWEIGVPDSESVTRFATGSRSTVPRFLALSVADGPARSV